MTPPAAKKPVKRTVKPVRAAKSTKKPVKRVSKTASKSAKAFVGRIPSAARRITRTRKSTKSAGSVEVVRPPLVDVTPEIKKDIVVVKPEPVKASEPAAKPGLQPGCHSSSNFQQSVFSS